MKKRKGLQLLWVLIGVLFFMSCRHEQDLPPQLVVDKFECKRCRMLISDTRYAAAKKSEETYLVYDDIGCMLTSMSEADAQSGKIWVRDFQDDIWIEAEHAEFYLVADKNTPMGYGYIAQKAGKTKPTNMTLIGDFRALRSYFLQEQKSAQ